MQQRKYRVAVIGRTGRGDYGHGLDIVWRQVDNVEVVAVADENEQGRAAAAQRLRVRNAYGDYREMLRRARAVRDLIESKAVRRGLSLKIFDWGKVEPAGGNKVRQEIKLRRGLSDEIARSITKLIRDEFPKVKSQVQGDAVRVSGKSKDERQRVISRLRELDLEVPLQFENYR